MPGKPSRRKRKQYALQGKKREERLTQPATPAQQTAPDQAQPQAVAPSVRPVTPPARPSPARQAKAQPALAQNPLLGTELRTIGILAGTLLVILVVLSIVLS
jgi:hypothetical protein